MRNVQVIKRDLEQLKRELALAEQRAALPGLGQLFTYRYKGTTPFEPDVTKMYIRMSDYFGAKAAGHNTEQAKNFIYGVSQRDGSVYAFDIANTFDVKSGLDTTGC